MKKKNRRWNFTFKVMENGSVTERCQTHSKRRFFHRIRTIKWQRRKITVYLKVFYGLGETNLGTIEPFYNDGEYSTKKTLMQALAAFTESGVDN
jgi:hypothetical protein